MPTVFATAASRLQRRVGYYVLSLATVSGQMVASEVFSDLSPDLRVRHGDELVVVGTDEGTNCFLGLLG